MEYKRLSTEQFEALHQEFAAFLAANSIDKKEWDHLKEYEIDRAELYLDTFSDLVWNDVFKKNIFIEHINSKHYFLFECLEEEMNLILIKTEENSIDFTTPEGFIWMEENFQSDMTILLRSQKKYKNRKHDIFDLIQKGGNITDGTYYKSIASFLLNHT